MRARALIDDKSVWIGLNNGEWGGGLIRIGRATGAVTRIASNATGTLCGGPLNTDCDSVNAIVRSPSRSSCVLAAVGLVHMMSHGRLVEVCGDRVRRVYYRAFDLQPPHLEEGADEPGSTVAFTDMVRLGDDVWMVGIDGLYRFSGTGRVSILPLPRFETRGSYAVAYPDPRIALVLTGANGVASVSGALPLMVAR